MPHTPTPSSPLDRLGFFLFLASLCALSFVAGAAGVYYERPFTKPLRHALEGGRAWIEQYKTPEIKEAQSKKAAMRHIDAIQKLMGEAKVTWNKEKSYNGYTLLTFRYSTTIWLIDMQGHIVHRWYIPFKKAWPNPTHIHDGSHVSIMVEDAAMLPNGDVIAQFSGVGDTPYGYGLAKIDKDSNVIWTVDDNIHHDFYMDKTNSDIYALGHKMIYDPLPDLPMLDYPTLTDYAIHLSPEGKEIDRIMVARALVGTAYEALLTSHLKSLKWDNFHSNSVEKLEPSMAAKFPMFHAGDILVSIRNINALVVIDHVKKKVIWAQVGPWQEQHAGHFLPNGTIVAFDNKGGRVNGKHASRVVAVNPATHKPVFTFPEQGEIAHSEVHGRIQSLPNDDLLVTASQSRYIMELTPDKKIVWSYEIPMLKLPFTTITDIMTGTRYSPEQASFLKNEKPFDTSVEEPDAK